MQYFLLFVFRYRPLTSCVLMRVLTYVHVVVQLAVGCNLCNVFNAATQSILQSL